MMDDPEHRIRQKAHEIWLMAGCPEGLAEDHWFRAQEFIRAEDFLASVSAPNPALEADCVPVENATSAGGAVAHEASELRRSEVRKSVPADLAAGKAAPERVSGKRTLGKTALEAFKNGTRPPRPLVPQWGGSR